MFAAPPAWHLSRGRTRTFWALVLPVLLLSDSIPNLIKLLTLRPRPFVELADVRFVLPVAHLRDFGFPSNHATNAFALAVLARAAFGGGPATAGLLAGAALMALSRVYIGAHYPLDVAAGAALGAAIAAAAWHGCALAVQRSADPRRAFRACFIALLTAGGVMAVAWRALRAALDKAGGV